MPDDRISAKALHGYLWEGIRREVYPDRIELYLPICFGAGDSEPLCLIWTREGKLTDGGRTLAELKKRIGNTVPYQKAIRRILADCGMVELVGGRQLELSRFQTVIVGGESHIDYLGGLTHMLRAISLISVVDAVTVTEEG